jgi:hypothetical protein
MSNPLHFFKQFEVPLPIHFGCPEQIPDDKDGDFIVRRYDQRPNVIGLRVDEVISPLAREAPSVSFEHADETPVMNWNDSRQGLLGDSDAGSFLRQKIRSLPTFNSALEASLF